MAYHSNLVVHDGLATACGCPPLPLNRHIKGLASASDTTDIVDEAISFFRANVFFKNFDIKSSADKLLIYLTLYINVALKKLEGYRTLAEGTKAIKNLGLEKVPVPGRVWLSLSRVIYTTTISKRSRAIQKLSKANSRGN